MDAGQVVLKEPSTRRIRVVVAKVGLDGHEVGAHVVARGLREAGFEVIYTGLRRTPEQVVEIALQEDADVIGISTLSGAHTTLVRRVTTLIKSQGLEDVLLILGGVIPDADAPELRELGVDAIFHPATTIHEIATLIREKVRSV